MSKTIKNIICGLIINRYLGFLYAQLFDMLLNAREFELLFCLDMENSGCDF